MTTLDIAYADIVQIFKNVMGVDPTDYQPGYGGVEFTVPSVGILLDELEPTSSVFGANEKSDGWLVFLYARNSKQLRTFLDSIEETIQEHYRDGLEITLVSGTRIEPETQQQRERHGFALTLMTNRS